jgi:monothiol glutaredoxin
MGLVDRIKKRLPIVGGGPAAAAPRPPAGPARYSEEEDPPSSRGPRPVAEFIDELVKGNPIVIFMKGSPQSPMCGFSANASAILLSYGKPLAHFDVLSDPEVRQAIKDYSNWPTLPQIYVGGEFLGGNDIVVQMHQSGELREAIQAATGAQA